jgi:hypothetical protein
VSAAEEPEPLTALQSERRKLVDALRSEKVYLGDGAYVRHDGWNVVLYTSDGLLETNAVCLEPDVLAAFEQYLVTLKSRLARIKQIDAAL